MFDLADYIIAHNTTMKDYLINERNVDKQKIYILELFDYLVKHDNTCKEYQENNRLTIAGNLDQNKSGYIYSIIKQSNRLSFNLYGVNYMNIFTSDKCQYYGSFSPDILPNILTGAFGIVWDGPQLNTCAGTVGNYVRYNNPHKVSLYIAASLPIIIWRHAALAQFVEKENIGILIDDLNQLEKLVSTISEEQYRNMKQNITKLSYKVKNGFYLNKVMDEILLNFNQKK